MNTKNIKNFILRQKIYFEKVNNKSDQNVLRLNFEDIVLDYENQLQIIYDFLKIDSSSHINKNKFFKPKLSAKNIGLWKHHNQSNEIKLISKELKDHLYHK